MKDVFQAPAGAVGRQDENAAVLDRRADERDDVFMANFRHLFQFLAHVPGQIDVLVTDGLDGH